MIVSYNYRRRKQEFRTNSNLSTLSIVLSSIKVERRPKYRVVPELYLCICDQCCGAGAGGAEIILGPGAGAENKFNKHFLQSVLRMLG